MSSTEASAAIERIRTDDAFARAVADEGTAALAGFDLTDADRAAIVDAFRRDVAAGADASDEVEGYGVHGTMGMPFANLLALELGGQDGSGNPTITTGPDELYPTKPGKARKTWT